MITSYDEPGIRGPWLFWLVIGVLVTLVGIAALSAPVATTLASAWLLGLALVAAGIVQIIAGFRESRGSGRFLYIGLGVLEIVVGWIMAASPTRVAVALTLLVAAYLLVEGILRVVMAASLKIEGWGWMAAGGAITAFLGLLVFAQWPYSGLWFNGVAIGVSLLTQGLATVVLSLSLRHRRPTATVP